MFTGSIWRHASAAALALALSAGMMGCSSKQEKALEEAKKQAVSSGQPQQIVSVDKDGNTVTTVVQPPAPGQKDPTVVTTTAPPPAGQPKPKASGPVVSSLSQPAPPAAPDNSTGAANSPAMANSPAAANAPAPAPVSIPAGTSLSIRIDQSINVKTARAGDSFSGEVVDPVMTSDNGLVVPKGTRVRGIVDEAHKRGHFKGASVLALRLTSMKLNGAEYPIETRDVAERKKGKGKRTAAMIGGGSGLGMLIGGVATGGAGLLWGGLAGAGAGTAAAGLTGNRDLVIPAESVLHFKLAQDVVLQQGQ